MAYVTPPIAGRGSPAVTPDFLRAFKGACFAVDRIVLGSGASRQPYIVAPHPGAPATTPATWGLHAPDGSVPCYAITLAAFRVLEAATAQPDGSFSIDHDITLADGGKVPAGTVGRLAARDAQHAVVVLTVDEAPPPPPPPPPVASSPESVTETV